MGKLKKILSDFLHSASLEKLNKIVPFLKNDTVKTPYSKRIESMTSSAIREILKVTSKKDFISFAGGLPDENLFPMFALKKMSKKVLKDYSSKAFQYSVTEGYEPLRQFIIDNFYKDADITTDNILITHGSQQGIDLLSKLFLDEDDKVGLSEPGYLGALQAFKAYRAKPVSIPSGEISLDKFEKIEKLPIKFLYVIPDFHNPTGERMSLEMRKKLVETGKHMIVEDTAYRLLSFDGDILPSLYELDKNGRVIQMGSFSKIIAPGLRIGWICASKEIIDYLVIAKQFSDLHTNGFGQLVVYSYLTNENWLRHVRKLRRKYKQKKDIMLDAIKKYFPSGYTLTEPLGGMFIWLTYKDAKLDFYDILETAVNEGVAFVPGQEFAFNKKLNNSVRLNFSHPSKEKIEEGIKKLGQIIENSL